jgi:DNA-binding MarR family transcriptional regulator
MAFAPTFYLQAATFLVRLLLMTNGIRENLQLLVRRFGLLNASCCELCCGETISLVQCHILFEIRRMGNPSMQQVADELGIDITTFSRQVKGMQEKTWLRRSISAEDRRVNLLALTEEGARIMGQIDRYLEEWIQRIFSFMTPFERDIVIRSLGLLNDALTKAGAAADEKSLQVASDELNLVPDPILCGVD